MKRLSPLALFFLLACSSNSSKPAPDKETNTGNATEAGAPTSESDAMQATDANTTVVARVHLKTDPTNPEPVVDLGQPISLVYAKQNTGPKTVQVWHAGFWPNHRILVLNPAGKAPAMTEMGKSGLAAFSPRGPRDKNFEWSLKPGVVDKSEGNYDLTTLFTFTNVGRHTVQVDYEEEMVIRSNVLPFWVAPSGTRALLDKLNGWNTEETDVIERPDAYPGRIAAGESNGFIDMQKEVLAELGVTVGWDADNKRYLIASINVK